MLPRAVATGLLVVALAATGQPLAQSDRLRTRAETSNYEETSTYADVERMVSALATSPLVHVESFGRSEEGRDLPLLVISQPKVATPAEARKLGRPLVFVQANIHAGEVEGKEASLILARRLVDGDLQALTRQLVILMAPIYNADGNERRLGHNRAEQNGPIGSVGTRENARGLDLNRDYMKLESAEARALVGLLNAWDPHVVADLHTTNGSYHGYHLTFAPTLTPNADVRLASFTRETLLPGVRKALLDDHGYRSYFYGNFAPEAGGGRESARVDPANPGDTVWRTFDHRPRFGNNYVGLRNRIAVLSEAYSYLDFQARVAVTSAFTEELLRACARQAARILTLTAQADRAFTVRTRQAKPIELGLEFQIQPNAELSTILVGDVTESADRRRDATDDRSCRTRADEGVRQLRDDAHQATALGVGHSAGARGESADDRRARSFALARHRDRDAGPAVPDGRGSVRHPVAFQIRARISGPSRSPALCLDGTGGADSRSRNNADSSQSASRAARVLPARAR
jgi:hypothetical protein